MTTSIHVNGQLLRIVWNILNFKVMGDIADGMINGDFDSLTGEYIGEGDGYPRTRHKEHADAIGIQYVEPRNPEKYAKSTREIRKELAILIKKTKKENPDKKENVIVDECRKAINIKYGKGWREQF